VARPEQLRYDWLTFTSDYGLDDIFVGVCKGVLAQIAPHVRIIDVSHFVQQQDVEQGADTLAAAIPYLPVAVNLALVDPIEIVTSRGVVLETVDGSIMVGPDNGLMSRAWDGRGGVRAAHEIANPQLWRDPVHQTFRGRDVFSPVAAHLANGRALADVGPAIAVESLTRLPLHDVVVDDDHVHAEVSLVDHFGNVALTVDRSDLGVAGIEFGDTVELRCNGQTHVLPFLATFADVARGRLTLCEDSFHAVQVSRNGGHAGQLLRVRRGDPVVISRLPLPQAALPLPPVTSATTD
jgi:S-adenosyl-L-methionine hydrolase (adenosine-forming)